MLSVEDWAEIRRLHRAERMPIKAIARLLGISRNTVRAAIASDAPPKYERKPAGSVVDAVEPRIRELLQAYPRDAGDGDRRADRLDRGLTVLKDRVRELRPVYLPPDPASRTSYVAGEIAQCDLWFPPVELPVGFGQVRRPAQLPVLTMVTGYSRWLSAVLIPSRKAEDLFAGWWQLIAALGAVPRVLVWDGEGAIGRWRGGRTELTAECQAFRGTLAAKVVVCKPADPEAKGLVERAHDYLERSFLPGRSLRRPGGLQRPAGRLDRGGEHPGAAGRWAARRPTGSPPTGRRCWRCRRSRRRPGGGPRRGCPATTTSGWTATTTPSTRPSSAAASRSSPTWPGSGCCAAARLVADHERAWAWHQTITDPEHTRPLSAAPPARRGAAPGARAGGRAAQPGCLRRRARHRRDGGAA